MTLSDKKQSKPVFRLRMDLLKSVSILKKSLKSDIHASLLEQQEMQRLKYGRFLLKQKRFLAEIPFMKLLIQRQYLLMNCLVI